MGFGHRDERDFDGVLRLAVCVDGPVDRQVGVEVRQHGDQLGLRIHCNPGGPALDPATFETVRGQVARVLSVDHDGAAFSRLCQSDRLLAPRHAIAPGFRPVQFYSPYEASVWSILSARRPRNQAITLRARLGQQFGASFMLAGVSTVAVPTPSALLEVGALPGLPADRVPRLRAVAAAAQEGRLSVSHLVGLGQDATLSELQKLPGIGPFYAALIWIRSTGVADALPLVEGHGREAIRRLYGVDHDLDDQELAALAESWRPFRTWVAVAARALSPRLRSPGAPS